MPEIKQLASNIVYQNKWMRVREDKIERPSGAKGIYSVVEKPDFAIIIPVIDNQLVLVEQFRYPIQKRSLEFPQGACESQPNIKPEDLARLELKEETGFTAKQITHIGKQALAIGFSDQFYNIFFATDLQHGETELDPEEEGLTTHHVSFDEFEAMIENGDILDATTTTAYCLAKFKGCFDKQKSS